jgi:hypothetical protein
VLTNRTNRYFTALVDVAAGSCRTRGDFWRTLKEFGVNGFSDDRAFQIAFTRMSLVSKNAAKEYYNEHFKGS